VELKKQNKVRRNPLTRRINWWFLDGMGWDMGKMGEGEGETQASTCGMYTSQG